MEPFPFERFQFETRCVSPPAACRFTEKPRFFRSVSAGRRCAAASRFPCFKNKTPYFLRRPPRGNDCGAPPKRLYVMEYMQEAVWQSIPRPGFCPTTISLSASPNSCAPIIRNIPIPPYRKNAFLSARPGIAAPRCLIRSMRNISMPSRRPSATTAPSRA